MAETSKPTMAEIEKFPRNDGVRCSIYCPKCREPKGSSMNCYAHGIWKSYTWWKCRSCKHRYDMTVYQHAEAYRDGFGLDEVKKGRKRAA
jgi:hypothetical protein